MGVIEVDPSMICTVDEMIEKFDVQPSAEQRFLANPLSGGRGIVDASQILAQSIVAASKCQPGKNVKSIHMIFARIASDQKPIELEVDAMHSGRSFGSVTVTAVQEGRLCARGLVLLNADEPDLIRHCTQMPVVAGPDDAIPLEMPVVGRDIRTVEEIDLMDPNAVGPPELNVWLRYENAPEEPWLNQALIGHFSNHLLIATAMRPHQGVAQSMAHRSLSAGVLTLTVVFHDPAKANEWLLYAHESPHAGRGLSYGRAHIFTQDGRLIASFTQENMIRNLPADVVTSTQRRDRNL